MENDRNKLNDLLLDKQSEKSGINIKKFIVIGLVVCAIVIGAIMYMDISGEDGISNSLVEPSILEQNTIKQSNPSLFKEADNRAGNMNDDMGAKKDPTDTTSGLIKQLIENNKKEKEKELLSKEEPGKNTNMNTQNKNNQPQDLRNMGQTKPPISLPSVTKPPAPKIMPTDTIARGFYVQVGAFYTRLPDKPFLDRLKSKGYDHQSYKVRLNNKYVTKVLIGPYQTRTDALSQLPSIKTSIEKQAFILKIN